MKSRKVAWIVGSTCDEGNVVVFAETREQARNVALSTGEYDNSRYIDMRVYRIQRMDKYYRRGKKIMDFSDPTDRLALVKDADFWCLEHTPETCAECSAKEYCYVWEREDVE